MNRQGLCAECFEPIINPICANCFIKQISQWMKESRMSNETKKNLIIKIKAVSNNRINNPENETTCAICRKQEVSICSYCFFLKANEILVRLNIEKRLKDRFAQIFNYRQDFEEDFEHY